MSTRVKKCWICGDKGTGFNYDCLSCESCKVFFHRNAAKPEKLKCRKDGNCEIDFATRKSCTKCRLDKCFAMGMKWKSASDAVGENSAERSSISSTANSNGKHPLVSENDHDIRNILEEDLQCKIQSTYDENATNLLHYGPTSDGVPFVRKKKYAADLTPRERSLIGEVQHAMTAFDDESKVVQLGDAKEFMEVVNLPVHYIRRMVRFCKQMSAFAVLKESDKLLILKPFFIEIMSIWFTYIYDKEKDGHLMFADEKGTTAVFISFEVCCKMHSTENMSEHRKNGLILHDEMGNDAIIRDLLIAQCLFKPRDSMENSSHSEFIRYQYFIYCRLLRRYLEHKYKSVNHANKKYTTLMRCLAGTETTKDIVRKMFDEIDIKQLSHILVEIYDF